MPAPLDALLERDLAQRTQVSASLRATVRRGSRNTKGTAIRVVAELAITTKANDNWYWSSKCAPNQSVPNRARLRTLIIIEKPNPSLPAGVERTARSISANSANV